MTRHLAFGLLITITATVLFAQNMPTQHEQMMTQHEEMGKLMQFLCSPLSEFRNSPR